MELEDKADCPFAIDHGKPFFAIATRHQTIHVFAARLRGSAGPINVLEAPAEDSVACLTAEAVEDEVPKEAVDFLIWMIDTAAIGHPIFALANHTLGKQSEAVDADDARLLARVQAFDVCATST